MAVIGSPLALLGHSIYVHYFNPMFYSDMIAYGMSQVSADIDTVLAKKELSDYFNLMSYSLQIIMSIIGGGALFSAIIAWFMCTKNLLTVS